MCEYIIGYSGKWWHFFMKAHVGLCYEKKSSFKFSDEEVLRKGAGGDFCVIASGRYIHVVCQDSSGDIVYMLYDGTAWQHEILLESKTAKIYNKNFSMINSNGYINLLYTIEYKERLMLIHQVLKSESTPEVVDYLQKRSRPYFAASYDTGDFSVFYHNEKGESCENLYKWSKKAFSGRVETDDAVSVRFADFMSNPACLAGIEERDGRNALFFVKREEGAETKTIVYHECEDNVFPVISRYNEKLYIVWTERGLILSSYSTTDGESWSKPLKYASGNPSGTTLYGVCTGGNYNYFYGLKRNNDISLYGTHDILKKAPPVSDEALSIKRALRGAESIAENTQKENETAKKIAEQEKILLAMIEELSSQREFISELCSRIDALTGEVPLSDDGDVDEVLMK